MQYIIEWTNCIISVTILFTIVELIIPDGSQKKTILMVTGIMTTIAIATPVIELFSKDFELSQVFNIDEYISDFEISTDDIVNKQIEELSKTYSENILKTFNEKYTNTPLNECKVYFNKDVYGKIEDISRIEVVTELSDDKMRIRIAEIAEVSDDKIIILVMPKEDNPNGQDN